MPVPHGRFTQPPAEQYVASIPVGRKVDKTELEVLYLTTDAMDLLDAGLHLAAGVVQAGTAICQFPFLPMSVPGDSLFKLDQGLACEIGLLVLLDQNGHYLVEIREGLVRFLNRPNLHIAPFQGDVLATTHKLRATSSGVATGPCSWYGQLTDS